ESTVPQHYTKNRRTSQKHVHYIKPRSSRIGTCSAGGEKWHREVAASYNLHLRVLGGDGNMLQAVQS
ncbi:MAG: hypothetical protein QXD60_04355, partial [Nanopusillaceae archaeon]